MTPTRVADPATLCAQAGRGTGDGEPLVPPIVQSTTFARDGIESAPAHAYSRVSNPTVAALERALGALEDAPPAVAFASGLAAETALFQACLSAGDHVVLGRALYGGTTRLVQRVLARLGVRATFADACDLDALAAAFEPRTRLVLLETPANPTLDVTDVAAASALAHARGALVAVDNTFLTAVLQRPLDLGADVTVTSTTKMVDGHSVALGGALCARDEALCEELRFVRKCTGAIQSPLGAWLTLLGLKTLPLRLERQSASAARVADALLRRDDVERVHYPPLSHPELSRRQHAGAHGAVVSFVAAGGYARAAAIARAVRLCVPAEHVGSVETLLTHSASMTHAGVAPEERRRAGVGDGLLRLSVGLERVEDVICDLERALEASAREAEPCASA